MGRRAKKKKGKTRTDYLYDPFPLLHYRDLPGRADLLPILCYLAYDVVGWHPYNLHDERDLFHGIFYCDVFPVRSVLYYY